MLSGRVEAAGAGEARAREAELPGPRVHPRDECLLAAVAPLGQRDAGIVGRAQQQRREQRRHRQPFAGPKAQPRAAGGGRPRADGDDIVGAAGFDHQQRGHQLGEARRRQRRVDARAPEIGAVAAHQVRGGHAGIAVGQCTGRWRCGPDRRRRRGRRAGRRRRRQRRGRRTGAAVCARAAGIASAVAMAGDRRQSPRDRRRGRDPAAARRAHGQNGSSLRSWLTPSCTALSVGLRLFGLRRRPRGGAGGRRTAAGTAGARPPPPAPPELPPPSPPSSPPAPRDSAA